MLQLVNPQWSAYELLDSGGYEKLERYGAYVLRRPEPQAVWPKRLTESEWEARCHAWFKKQKPNASQDSGERGEWVLRKGMPDQWVIEYPLFGQKMHFRLGMTAFKHIGIFPEQSSNWDFIHQRIQALPKSEEAEVLNLFAYTGGASLAAALAGARVTHVDSVKPVVNWARENATATGTDRIRWIVEDAMKFVLRAQRRGSRYHGILLDPPAYGRGADGEKWILESHITRLLEVCAELLLPGGFVVLNLYSMGFSPIIAENLLHYYFKKGVSEIESGELMVADTYGVRLPLSVYARF